MSDLATRIAAPGAPTTGGVLCFDVTGPAGGTWLLQLNAPARVGPASAFPASTTPDCTFRLSAADLAELFEGRISGQQLFFDGRLEVDGDLTRTLTLPAITRLLRPTGA